MQVELLFALFEGSVSGLRFARLFSQRVSAPLRRRSAFVAKLSLIHRIENHRSSRPPPHFQVSRRMLRLPVSKSAKFVPLGHQRPNPSVEGTAKRLRLLSAPHLER